LLTTCKLDAFNPATGVAITYRNAALVTVTIGLFLFLLIIPGTFENKKLREQYKRRRACYASLLVIN